jgi:NAD(P)-dependent dehydrogenase (short-subunit alcohol dehydrogenase family)
MKKNANTPPGAPSAGGKSPRSRADATGSLAGQAALVSGGLGDIGRAIVLELARRGADVGLGDVRKPQEAAALLKQVQSLKRRARYDCVDVSDAQAVREWVDAVERDLGTPTLIVPNAAIVKMTRFNELTPEYWRKEMSVNLDGAFYMARFATAKLVAQNKPGRVVFVGSWAAHAVHLHIPAYCVGKAGLRMLCQCMAAELADRDILVNEVAPGYVDAGLTAQLMREVPGARERATKAVPIGRMISADEVALQVAHLCDPANRHMTGSTLVMDGGLTLYGPGGRKE